MAYKRLFIFVEGDDDERFFKTVIVPYLCDKHSHVDIIKYAQKNRKLTHNYLKSIRAMEADCLFVVDINNNPCVSEKKSKIKNKYKMLDEDQILVVVKEIEGWYVAGLKQTCLSGLRLTSLPESNLIIKEQFNNLQPKKFESRIDFMVEILKNFSLETAKQNNTSFKYFADRFL